ncbi:unannotated protein [freshwater metagenome]|uniref:Unannotated protein n=1 Tax=freshwater metagenome TaxID=449393 RepID=A0A6J7DZP5_9ZZZZ
MPDNLLLVTPFEAETRDVGAGVDFTSPHHDVLITTTNLVKNSGGGVEIVARLVDVGQLYRWPHGERSAVGDLLLSQHAKQRGLSRTVRSDDTNDATGRQDETQVIQQYSITKTLLKMFGVNHKITKARSGRDCYFHLVGTLVG